MGWRNKNRESKAFKKLKIIHMDMEITNNAYGGIEKRQSKLGVSSYRSPNSLDDPYLFIHLHFSPFPSFITQPDWPFHGLKCPDVTVGPCKRSSLYLVHPVSPLNPGRYFWCLSVQVFTSPCVYSIAGFSKFVMFLVFTVSSRRARAVSKWFDTVAHTQLSAWCTQ